MDPFTAISDQLFHQGMDIKHVQAIQTMHAERLLKLERKQADDAALKSVWTSPFPSVLTGTPNQGPVHTPSANVFDDFDDEHCQSLLGSLHLDEEPVRRGASRANSVRFADDFSAVQGPGWGHASRPSNDFSARPNSAFGRSHSMERTMSHKSEGRHSSAGHSIHSAHSVSGRTSSLGLNNHFAIGDAEDAGYVMPAPPPGLFVLGTVPTIIRCWLNQDFSHNALLYAVVCTGSQKSTVDHRLLKELGLIDQVQKDANGNSFIRLPVYLPEAVVTQPTSRPCSPGPHLPSMTVNFDVTDIDSAKSSSKQGIRVFLGSDTLRTHMADLLLSKNRMEISSDDESRLRVAFVRPEDDSVFKNIVTGHVVREKAQLKGTAAPFTPAGKRSSPTTQGAENEPMTPAGSSRGRSPVKSDVTSENEQSATESTEELKMPLKFKTSEGAKLAIDSQNLGSGAQTEPASATESKPKSLSSIGKSPTSAAYPHSSAENRDSTSASGIWSSWRSGPTPTSKEEDPAKESTSASGYNKPGRGIRSMKVLKPSKALPTTARSVSSGAGIGMGSLSSIGQIRVGTGSSYEPPPQSPLFDESRRKSGPDVGASASLRWDAKKAAAAEEEPKKMKLISGSKTANPIGTASAFSWMKPGTANTKPSMKSSD